MFAPIRIGGYERDGGRYEVSPSPQPLPHIVASKRPHSCIDAAACDEAACCAVQRTQAVLVGEPDPRIPALFAGPPTKVGCSASCGRISGRLRGECALLFSVHASIAPAASHVLCRLEQACGLQAGLHTRERPAVPYYLPSCIQFLVPTCHEPRPHTPTPNTPPHTAPQINDFALLLLDRPSTMRPLLRLPPGKTTGPLVRWQPWGCGTTACAQLAAGPLPPWGGSLPTWQQRTERWPIASLCCLPACLHTHIGLPAKPALRRPCRAAACCSCAAPRGCGRNAADGCGMGYRVDQSEGSIRARCATRGGRLGAAACKLWQSASSIPGLQTPCYQHGERQSVSCTVRPHASSCPGWQYRPPSSNPAGCDRHDAAEGLRPLL